MALIAGNAASVTVAILTKNQAAGIAELIADVRKYARDVVVVDGHSTDGTREAATRAGARVTLDGGRGKGDGVRAAIEAMGNDILVLMDGDGSCHIPDIPNLVAPIAAGTADVVGGSRMRGGSDEPHARAAQVFRMFGNGILTLLVNYRFGLDLTDSQTGFRAVRSEVARSLQLRETGGAIELEFLLACAKGGHRVTEVPSHEYARRFGRSALVLRREWFRLLICIARHIV